MMIDEEATQERKTMVLWDINTCPVPDGYDARMIAQSIERALKKAGHSGPLTITAIGHLNDTLNRAHGVLPAIYSTGIHLKNIIPDYRFILQEFTSWKHRAPATLMLISGAAAYSASIVTRFSGLQRQGYTTLLAYPQHANFLFDSSTSSTQWRWEDLLQDAMSSGENCCETGDGSAWLCSICSESFLTTKQNLPITPYSEFLTLKGDRSFKGKSFEEFTKHLKSRDHALCELNWVSRPIKVKVFNLIQGFYWNDSTTTLKRSIEDVYEKEEIKEAEAAIKVDVNNLNEWDDDEQWERLTV